MKFNFKKISAIATSVLLTGMTAGIAAAADYPLPFVTEGVADVAIVYGTGTGVSVLDATQAGNIQTDLGTYMAEGDVTVTSEDSVLIETATDKFNLGDEASGVFARAIRKGDLPTLLADGTYKDDGNTEYDYTQKIDLGNKLALEHFRDGDYELLAGLAENTPVIGMKFSSGEHILNYTLDFTTNPAYNATIMETTTLNLMGKEYYVLDVKGWGDTGENNKTTLLDSADSLILTYGEISEINGKQISISFVGSAECRIDIDGETTNSLAEGGTYKLSDGTYIGVKDIMYAATDAGISKVEISVGTGKLVLPHGTNIELNDNTVDEIKSFMVIDSTGKLDKIVLEWKTSEEEFLTPEVDLVMPAFEAVKGIMGSWNVPSPEETRVENNGENIDLIVPIKTGTPTIPLLKVNATGHFSVIGKDSENRLVTSPQAYIYVNETAGDKYIVASYNTTQISESYYLEVDVYKEGNVFYARFKDKGAGGENWEKVVNGSSYTPSGSSIVLTVATLNYTTTTQGINITANDGVSFNRLYTNGGLEIFLPYYTTAIADEKYGALNYTNNGTAGGVVYPDVRDGVYGGELESTAGHGWNDFYLWFEEEDKENYLGNGNPFNLTIARVSATTAEPHVSAADTGSSVGALKIGETKTYEEYVNGSALATKILLDKSATHYDAKITYAGAQSSADIYIASPETTISSAGTIGEVLVLDSEVSSVATKNLIIVGGSCINSAAAALLGGGYCGESWTTATNVGTGQFLIKGYANADNGDLTSKLAVLVAGYEVDDTANAATYFTTQPVDTSAEYIGTSATEATMTVVTA